MSELPSYLGAMLAATLLVLFLVFGTGRGDRPPVPRPVPTHVEEGAMDPVGRVEEGGALRSTPEAPSPCPELPLRWRLGEISPRFARSPQQALQVVADAAAIWERAVGRPLFLRSADPDEAMAQGESGAHVVPPDALERVDPVLTLRFLDTEPEPGPIHVGGQGEDAVQGMEAGAFRTLTVGGPDGERVLRREIRIYRSGDGAQLVRILAHEMGHALGLPHVDAPGFIMSPTFDDLEGEPRVHAESRSRLERCLPGPQG